METSALPNRYYIMRHGRSVPNEMGIIVSDPDVGVDPAYGLSEIGRWQAEMAAAASGLGRDTLIYASPFARTAETAQIARATIGAQEVTYDDHLRERYFGTLDGTSTDNYESVWAWDERDDGMNYSGVETIGKVALRALKLVINLNNVHRGRDILLVSHGDTLQGLGALASGLFASEHRTLPPIGTGEIRCLNFKKTV